jgi:hypothetical protein
MFPSRTAARRHVAATAGPAGRGTGLAALVALTALAAFAALATTPLASLPAAAAPRPSAQSEYKAALKAAGNQGVHFVSTATQGGVTIRVVGDTGATSGGQTLTVTKGSSAEHVAAKVVGSTGYVQANTTALHNVIGLTNAQSSKYAGQWLYFPTSNSALDELVGGLLNSQVSSQLQMGGPYTYVNASTVNGKPALAVRGEVTTQSGSKVPVVMYLPAGGTPLPLKEITNPGDTGGSSAIHGTVTFSNWGEKTKEEAPSHSVSLLKLVPASSGGTAGS